MIQSNTKNITRLLLFLPVLILALGGCIREGLEEQLYVEFKTGFYSTDITLSIDGELYYRDIVTTDTAGYASLFTTELVVGDYNITVTADTMELSESFDLNAPLLIEVTNSPTEGLQFTYQELTIITN